MLILWCNRQNRQCVEIASFSMERLIKYLIREIIAVSHSVAGLYFHLRLADVISLLGTR